MRYFMLWVVLSALISTGAAIADEVVLKNGEKVKGEVTGFEDGKIIVNSETMGDVKLPLEKVVTFSTDTPIELHFKDHSMFNQKIGSSSDGMISIPVGPDAAMMKFKVADIAKINPPKTVWKGNIAAAVSASRGNTYTQGGSVTLDAVRRGETDRISFDAGYTSQRQKEPGSNKVTTTQRKSNAGLQYDYFFNDKIYGYANARGERDAIAQIDVRLLAGAGGGWQIHESDTFNLSAETGLSWISENFLPPSGAGIPESEDVEYFAARLAYKTDAQLMSSLSFFHNATGYSGFEHAGGYYVTAEAGLRSSLTESMFAEFKALWAWDSTPAEMKKRTDVTYLLNLGWSF